jgi:ABC-type multidrug transport system fused ATPase/permease subunit
MSEPTLAEREASALATLEKLAVERARGESETDRSFRARQAEEERAYESKKNRITTQARSDTTETKAKYEAARDEINRKADAEIKALEAEYSEARKKIAGKAQGAKNGAKKRLEETRWQALAVYEAGKDGAVKQFKEFDTRIKDAAERLETFQHHARPPLQRTRRLAPPPPAAGPAEKPAPEQPVEALEAALDSAEERLKPVEKLFLPKLLAPSAFVWVFLALAGGLAYPLGTALGWGIGAGVAAGIALVVAVGLWIGLASVARKQVARVVPPLKETLDEATALVETSKQWTKATYERAKVEIEERRQRDADAAEERFNQAVAEVEKTKEAGLKEADSSFPPRIKSASERRDAALKDADEVYPKRLAEIQERFHRESSEAQEEYKKKQEETKRQHAEAWDALESRWRDGLAGVAAAVNSVNDQAGRLFLDWHNADVDAWQPPSAAPDGIRFGALSIDLANIPQGTPADERLKMHGPTRHAVPALVPFPRLGSVLIRAADAGKAEAVKLLQTLMLRYATSLPPGKVRFTIIDPVGLGENFAAFMHLSDYHELLVTSRIWTETPHIEQRLADLSSHMENVIQKYLRNEFETIEAYNDFAGEVAEPFRVLVVANFPANFSEAAARRLVTIATTGARCGVYTLISLDTKLTLPSGVQLKDLETQCVNYAWRDGAIAWRDSALGRLPLVYDSPPDPDQFTRLMHKVGALAREANRVEVPFEFIAPPREQYWTSDSRGGVDVPLGRAGATKLQHLRLGKGTSQHVLIAGKTGSGKSTLLHALITNAALRYSPDELEVYLIDFKKGVEFKVYAALELPHAKVIAVESEREFGLSVLQRLDAELKARGDRFRDLGVQDLAGYRDADGGKNPMPRILLIVDEFQEFFVEDDKIAQEVSLLLDRLVRQGRAFGIHVNLGSQSLGGAYSLARSTIGQMAVRIALQCSESDAHLILSEENSAARLLTRPGEAIYNDANGLVEGNNPFQVVWLSDERREHYLRVISDLARAHNRPPVSQIVFEGNLPAVPSKNYLLVSLLQAPAWPEPPKADYAWIGEAIAIKDPTAAVFRPQSGANLLIVGQNDEMALGIFAMCVIGLAAQHDPSGLSFVLLDGCPADSRLSGRLGQLRETVPHKVREVTVRDLAASIGEIAAEVELRQKGESTDNRLIFLFIYDIQRFRDLRKSDDDFGFSRYGEAKADPPSKLFGNILRDGPPLGIHTVVWCDSLNNLNRTFERQALRDFEMRVLFQMSANDSSTLIDAPAASRLGPNRALYFSEEEGRLEKCRPYGLPGDEWLDSVRTSLRARPFTPPPEPVRGHAKPAAVPAEPAESENGPEAEAEPFQPSREGEAPAEPSRSWSE